MANSTSETLFITSDSNNDEMIIRNRDACVASFCAVANWTYDIKEQTMTFVYPDDTEGAYKSIVFSKFNQDMHDFKLIYADDYPMFDVFCAELDAGKENVFCEFREIAYNYQQVWVRFIGHAVYGEDGNPVKISGRRFDISREKNSKEDVNEVEQDFLTGLFYRDKSRELVREALEKKPAYEDAMIIFDVDDFKSINDANGKVQGDLVLQTISGLINTNFMSKDIVGRIAGDQFFVFCEDIKNSKVIELVKSAQTRVGESVSMPDGSGVTLSAGISYYPKDGDTFEILYAKADMSLTLAKKQGKNRYVEFSMSNSEDAGVGYTLSKMGSFIEDELRVSTEDNKVNKKLFDYAFEELSREPSIYIAIQKIFEEVSLYYGLDRAALVELDRSSQIPKVTSKWCRVDDSEDASKIDIMPRDVWMAFETEESPDGYFIFEDGRCGAMDFFRNIVDMKNPPVSSIQFKVINNEEMLYALVNFESFERHVFKNSETSTLKSIVKLISSYILGQQVKDILEAETIISKNVMDAQRLVYYVIDGKSYELKYISKYAKNWFPNAAYGHKCYETIRCQDGPCDMCPFKNLNGEINSTQFYDEKEEKWISITASHMKDTDCEDDILICVTDVTEFLNKVRGEDTLTVADTFDKFIVDATKLIMRQNSGYAVICTGIQEFSKINDEFGYVIGDEILKRYADLIRNDIDDDELLCRVKGDDFILLIKQNNLTKKKVERLRDVFVNYSKILSNEFRQKCPGIDVKCFAGEYLISKKDKYINHCVDNALKARQVAFDERSKNNGFFVYSQELEESERQRVLLEKKMKKSLKNGGFKVFFQPKVDVNTKAIIGAEALVRLQDEDGKMISPGLFIPLAEKNGMIVDIDMSVYDQTFALMRKWIDQGKNIPLISVNVSRLHLLDDDLPNKIKKISDKYNLDPSIIELEITESVFFDDTDRLITMIKRLKDMGYVISMDDFGSGYSTLNIMKSLPVDVIKIDGGFFMRNEMDRKSKAIISAILQLTKNLEFDTVSEGVETEEQVEFVRSHGGRCVQGYYFYKPMPADDFEKLI
ncbi:MAG: EAL domain-containing protein [Lachnospiraceae bacterium]|nr:EAL domain-containing protein [Lachnospiraceae bacterium]